MEQRILVLCDPEEDYVHRMSDYMRRDKFFPWTVKEYTHIAQLQAGKKLQSQDILVISERLYEDSVQKLGAGQTVILNETGIVKGGTIKNVDKYQEAGKVVRQLLEFIGAAGQIWKEEMTAKLIGLYSPIHRCLQTSYGLCLGKLLARKGKTLYLSFEQYCGVEGMEKGSDLSSLLYLLSDEENFAVSAGKHIARAENFDYVSTMINGQNLLMIDLEEWKKLLYHLQHGLGYEYIILDLSENIQGLFQILRMCVRVYSMAKDDPIAKRKLDQYEQLLSMLEYEDVKKKTSICRLPLFRDIPLSIEGAAKGDLADYVRRMTEKEEWY